MPALQLARESTQGGGSSLKGWMVASMIATPPTKRSHLPLKAATARAEGRAGRAEEGKLGSPKAELCCGLRELGRVKWTGKGLTSGLCHQRGRAVVEERKELVGAGRDATRFRHRA